MAEGDATSSGLDGDDVAAGFQVAVSVAGRVEAFLLASQRALGELHASWLRDGAWLSLSPSELAQPGGAALQAWVAEMVWRLRQEEGSVRECALALEGVSGALLVRGRQDDPCGDDANAAAAPPFSLVSSLHATAEEGAAVSAAIAGAEGCLFARPAGMTMGCNFSSASVEWATRAAVDAPGGDERASTWYQAAVAAAPGTAVWAPPWSDGLPVGELRLGAAVALRSPSSGVLMGALRCGFTLADLDVLLGTALERDESARLIAYDRGGGLLSATSHGARLGAGGARLRPWESGDTIVDLVGQALRDDPSSQLPHVVRVASPALNSTISAFVLSTLGALGPIELVYVPAMRCIPGHVDDGPGRVRVGPPGEQGDEVSACAPCARGHFGPPGMGECKPCMAGLYQELIGQLNCHNCPSQTFANATGSIGCTACPSNTLSLPGSSDAADCLCAPGYFAPSGTAGEMCVACPTGAMCDGGLVPPYAKNKHYNPGTPTGGYLRCPAGISDNPCLGGIAGGPTNQCKVGTEGVSCSHCSAGYYRFGRDCVKCNVHPFVRFLMYAVLITLFYIIRRVINTKYRVLYIFMSFLQVFGLQSSFRVKWTTNIKKTMRFVQLANLQIDLFVPLCAREIYYPYKYLAYFFMPVFFLGIDLCILGVGLLRRERKKKKEKVKRELKRQETRERMRSLTSSKSFQLTRQLSVFSAREAGPDPFDDDLSEFETQSAEERHRRDVIVRGFMDLADANRKAGGVGFNWRAIFGDFGGQALANMRLAYMTITGRSIDMLRCSTVKDPILGMRDVLSRDPDLVCWEGLHARYLVAVGFAFVVYVVGTPVAYFCVLFSGKRQGTLYKDKHLQRFGLLYNRFEPKYFYWELIIMLRRCCAVSVKTALNFRQADLQEAGYIGNYQAAIYALIMILALMAHFYTRPFKNPWLDFGEATYLLTTTISALVGLAFSSARTDTETQILESIFFATFSWALVVTVMVLWKDIETVHPRALRWRRRMTLRLRRLLRRKKVKRALNKFKHKGFMAALTAGNGSRVSPFGSPTSQLSQPPADDPEAAIIKRAVADEPEGAGAAADDPEAAVVERAVADEPEGAGAAAGAGPSSQLLPPLPSKEVAEGSDKRGNETSQGAAPCQRSIAALALL